MTPAERARLLVQEWRYQAQHYTDLADRQRRLRDAQLAERYAVKAGTYAACAAALETELERESDD